MRRIATALLLLIVLTGQAQDEKKGLKSYYKGKLDKAEEEFSKIVRMFRFSALGHYGMALLYSDERFAKADMFKAYEMMRTAVSKKKTIRPKKLEDVAKYFAPDSIDVLDKRINQNLYDSVMAKDSWLYTKSFLEQCKESSFYADVQKLGLHQQFRAVKDTNTVASYNWFIEEYPTEKQTEEAVSLRNALAYSETKKGNSLKAYQDFLDEYPDAEQYEGAVLKRDEFAYKETSTKNTIEAFKQFIEEYPEAKQLAQAQSALEGLEFAATQKANTDKAWETFLKNYPESKQIAKAQELREKLALQKATDLNTVDAFDYFMRKFPQSALYPTAFNKKTELISANFNFSLQVGAAPTSIKVFDRFNTVASAINHIKTTEGHLLLAKVKHKNKWKGDAWLVHLNNNGELIWEKQLGTSGDDAFTKVIEVSNGFILAGYAKGKNSTDREVWMLKLDKKGKTLWEQFADGVEVNGLVEKDGGAILATTYLDEDKMHQINLVHIDTEGKLIANKKHISLGFAKGLCRLTSGEMFMVTQDKLLQVNDALELTQQVAFTKGKAAFSIKATTDGVFALGRNYDFRKQTKSDFWLAKFGPDAKLVWEKTYDNTKQQDIAYDLNINADGSLMLVGLTEAKGSDNLHLIDIDAKGAEKSSKTLGTDGSEKRPTVQAGEGFTLLMSSGRDSDLLFLKY